jgi:S-DNA-T family DNA segregation ATPase FtsK/SpoIIIE
VGLLDLRCWPVTASHPAKSSRPGARVAAGAAAVAAIAVFAHAHAIAVLLEWAALVVVLPAVLIGLVVAAVRVSRSGWRPGRPSLAWWRHTHRAAWHAIWWRHVSKNLGLAYPDKHRPGKVKHPRAIVHPSRHGMTARLRTVPGTGRAELEAAAEHLANTWRCQRVSVTQPRPGRLIVRGLRTDPLLEQLTLASAPRIDVARPDRVWLGRDDHSADRQLELANVSGVCVGGQPGGGKSQAITSWLTQLAPSPAVQFATVDGKGAGEFDDFADRAWLTAGDGMEQCLDALEQLTKLMYARLAAVRDFTGGLKNIWTKGVSPDWPLQVSVFDETQQFLDLPAAKALGKEAEKQCAQAIKLGSELVRKGRSVGMLSIFATQKPTSDSLPSSISANCAVNLAFSLKTLDAAKATLGPDIGDYPSLSPVSLSLPEYAGVAVVSLRDGLSPFSRIRSPLVTEAEAWTAAASSAHLRRDPRPLVTSAPGGNVTPLHRSGEAA